MSLGELVAAGSCPASVQALPTVFVIDDDLSVRELLEPLIWSEGWGSRFLTSAEEFLAERPAALPGCLVLNMWLPGMGGLELQAMLADRQELPIIFIASDIDIPIAVRAMKAGAVDVLTKPFCGQAISKVIRDALEHSRAWIRTETNLRRLRERYMTLTAREKEVMALVVSGLLNKQIAFKLRISEITVKAHRGKVMRKMAVDSLAELVSLASRLKMARALPI